MCGEVSIYYLLSPASAEFTFSGFMWEFSSIMEKGNLDITIT